MTVIRAAAAADVPQAAIVKARGWRTSYAEAVPPDLLAVFSDPGHWLTAMKRSLGSPEEFLLVADDGTAVVGMAQGTFAPEPYLASLHVVPERRNQGIGALLMAHVARTAMDRGHDSLLLDVVATNLGAIAFYARLGAVASGEHPAVWASGVTEVRMVVADLPSLVRLARPIG